MMTDKDYCIIPAQGNQKMRSALKDREGSLGEIMLFRYSNITPDIAKKWFSKSRVNTVMKKLRTEIEKDQPEFNFERDFLVVIKPKRKD
jgi:hypothetical protein